MAQSAAPTAPLIDTHCHLDAAAFDADRDAVVQRAHAAGVGTLLVPATHADAFAATLAMRQRHNTLIALGLHPVYLPLHRHQHLHDLRQRLDQGYASAVGEIGLDFYLPELDPNLQIDWFCQQLQLARDFDLPVILHIRRAHDVALKHLRRFNIRRGIAHAFNGSDQQAHAYLQQGLKLGFGGTMTYPQARNIRRLASSLPVSALVLESDAPDLPPAWIRQQRNEPHQVARFLHVLAEIRQQDPAILRQHLFDNIRELLGPAACSSPPP